jgi:hypothetical protein
MTDPQKGVLAMAGFIGTALSALFRENEDIVAHAKIVAGQAACRVHHREEVTNLMTGEKRVVWQIEFPTQEDASQFDSSVRELVRIIVEEGE